MLGAACVQIAFNLGNAIGAYCGGLTLHAGLDCRYPSLVGVPFAFTGCLLLYIFYKRYSFCSLREMISPTFHHARFPFGNDEKTATISYHLTLQVYLIKQYRRIACVSFLLYDYLICHLIEFYVV